MATLRVWFDREKQRRPPAASPLELLEVLAWH